MSTSLVLIAPPPKTPLPGASTLRDWAERLGETLPDVDVVVVETDAEAIVALESADAAYGTLPPGWKAPSLRWLHAPMAAPPIGYFTAELAEHPVVVTNMRGVYNDHIATHVMAFLLAFARGLPLHGDHQRQHLYRPKSVPTLYLPDATVLLIGAGGVGRQLARYLEPFGPRLVAVDATPSEVPADIGIDEVLAADELDRQLPVADVVVMTVPHTPETEGLMDRARFELMKSTAFFINIGRGMTVKLDDLVDAVLAGDLAGAGLDVFDQEPLPADHRIWDTPNVLITPHTAMVGPNLDDRRYQLIEDNCRRFLAGEPLVYVVDKKRGF